MCICARAHVYYIYMHVVHVYTRLYEYVYLYVYLYLYRMYTNTCVTGIFLYPSRLWVSSQTSSSSSKWVKLETTNYCIICFLICPHQIGDLSLIQWSCQSGKFAEEWALPGVFGSRLYHNTHFGGWKWVQTGQGWGAYHPYHQRWLNRHQ